MAACLFPPVPRKSGRPQHAERMKSVLNIKVPVLSKRALDCTLVGLVVLWLLTLVFVTPMTMKGFPRKKFYEDLPYPDFLCLNALGINQENEIDPRPILSQMKHAGITYRNGAFKDKHGKTQSIREVAGVISHLEN